MKKQVAILTFVVCAFQNTYSQQTLLVTKDKGSYYEEYSVLATDKKIKHGSYVKLNKSIWSGYAIESIGNYSNGKKNGIWESYFENNNNIKEKGYYRNDLRDSVWVFFYPLGRVNKLVKSNEGGTLEIANANPMACKTGKYVEGKPAGVWEFFDNGGEVSQKFDYDKQQVIYMRGQNLENYEVGFIGGEFLMYQYLYDNFDFDDLMKSINRSFVLKTGKITLKFTIDENGNIVEITDEVKTIENKKINERAMQTVQGMNKLWYPKRSNGSFQRSQKKITFDLIVESETSFSTSAQQTTERTHMGFKLKIYVD